MQVMRRLRADTHPEVAHAGVATSGIGVERAYRHPIFVADVPTALDHSSRTPRDGVAKPRLAASSCFLFLKPWTHRESTRS